MALTRGASAHSATYACAPQLRGALYSFFLDADTRSGRAFGIAVIAAILLSVATVCAESVKAIHAVIGGHLVLMEVVLTTLFAIEYTIRAVAAPRGVWSYVCSVFGIVDVLAVAPFLVEALVNAEEGKIHVLVVLRVLRLARVLRLLKLAHFSRSASQLLRVLTRSWRKVAVFLAAFSSLTVIVGALMYTIEGAESGFTSIPQGMYWAIVTLTTVGFGDIAPRTSVGRLVAALVMLLGYSLIVVPSGLASIGAQRLNGWAGGDRPSHGTGRRGSFLSDVGGFDDITGDMDRARSPQYACGQCADTRHAADASFCRRCGARLAPRFGAAANASGVAGGEGYAAPAAARAQPRNTVAGGRVAGATGGATGPSVGIDRSGVELVARGTQARDALPAATLASSPARDARGDFFALPDGDGGRLVGGGAGGVGGDA